MKRCSKCKLEKSPDNFYAEKARKDGLSNYCKSCSYEALKDWRISNPDKLHAINKRWLIANPEVRNKSNRAWEKRNPEYMRIKSKAHAHSLTKEEVKKILSQPCGLCGSTENLTIDHMYPVSKGGNSSLENLWALCRSCNSFKKDRLITSADKYGALIV